MKTKLTKSELDYLLPNIARVLITGDTWEDRTLHHPAGAIIAAILTLNGMKKAATEEDGGAEGFATNGWQWDWWQQFSHGGKTYTLSGSGFHGGHSFSLADE